MSRTKPDRFAMTIERAGMDSGQEKKALRLLRLEHRRVVAMVTVYRKKHWEKEHRNRAFLEGVLVTCDDILIALQRMKEGRR